MTTTDTHDYNALMYDRVLAHASCTVEVGWNKEGDEDFTETGSAIEIAIYADGENVAIECVKCNEVIIDFSREKS
jgi:hypothetical protein